MAPGYRVQAGLKSKIDTVCQNYMSDEDKQAYIRWLEDPANYSKLGEGDGRHNGLVTLGTSYYYRYNGDWKNYTDDERKAKLWEWNSKLAVPKSEKEFNGIWKWIVERHRRTRDNQHEKLRDERQDEQKSAYKEESNDQSQDRRNELIEIINEMTREIFVDKHDTAFAAVQIGEHVETLPIKSGRFKKWICRLNYQHLHKTIRAEDLKQITDLLQAEAQFNGNVNSLELRTSSEDIGGKSIFYYDLTNKTWQVVKITEDGWNVQESSDTPCPWHPDIAACVEFLHNTTNKRPAVSGTCTGMGDPHPNVICPQESNPEGYCLNTDDPAFCKTIGDLCDADGFVKPEYPYCKND